jgi:membrane-bound lytic murein transglycosylase
MSMEMKKTDDPGRPPSHVPYTAANLEKRLAAAGAELGAYLAADPGVQAAGTALEQAQARLQIALDRKAAVPYPGFTQRAPQRLREWQAAVSDVEQSKAEVAVAEKAWRVAQNDAAAARHSAQRQTQEQERAKLQEREAAQHAMLEEAAFKEQAWAAAIASGSTREQFDKMFEGLWRAELRRRTEARMGQERAAMIASGRYQF